MPTTIELIDTWIYKTQCLRFNNFSVIYFVSHIFSKCPAEYLKITTDEDEKLWYPTFLDMVGMDKANFAPFDIILEYILDGKLKPFTDLTDFCNNIKKGADGKKGRSYCRCHCLPLGSKKRAKSNSSNGKHKYCS